MVGRILSADKEVDIALVGKYVELHDAYLSVVEALSHAGYAFGTKVNIHWINSEVLEEEKPDLREVFKGIDGIVVPGGFGYRGVEGKSKPLSTPAPTTFPSWASAWACSAPSSNSPVTYAA